METPSSVEISKLIERIENQADGFREKAEVAEDDEIGAAFDKISEAALKLFHNLLPIWRKENMDFMFLPNINVSHMRITKRTTVRAKILQWFVWELELIETAMAYDGEEFSEIRKSILELASAYGATGRAFESKLKIKSFGLFEFGTTASPATTKDTLDGVIMSMAI